MSDIDCLLRLMSDNRLITWLIRYFLQTQFTLNSALRA